MSKKPDAETLEFMASLEQGLKEAMRGEGRVNTPSEIAERKRGRPVGSVQAQTKTPVTLRLPPDVLARWRSSGKGWQTRAAQVLAKSAPH